MKSTLLFSLLLLARSGALADDLTDALDMPGANWLRGGTGTPWHAGADAQGDYAEVADLPYSAEAWLETSVSGPGILSVEAEVPVSANGIEYQLQLFRDGVEQPGLPASIPAQIAVPAGSHTVRITISAPWHYGNTGGNHMVRVRSVALVPAGTLAAEAMDTPGREWFAMGWGRAWEKLPTGHDGDSLFIDSHEYARLETLVSGPATISFWQQYSTTEEGDASLDVSAADRSLAWSWGAVVQRLQAWVPPGDHWITWYIEGDGGHLSLDEFTATPSASVSIAEATDTVGVAGIGPWTTSPAVPWTGSTTPVAPDGVDFAAVFTIEDPPPPEDPWIATTVQGPGRLTWTGTGEARPSLSVNGTVVSGSSFIPEYPDTVTFLAAGANALRWTANAEGIAALDRVRFDAFGQTTAAEALDAPSLTFITGGSPPPQGVVTPIEARDGSDYLLFPTSGASWVETTVTGPGTLEFYAQLLPGSGTLSVTTNGAPLATLKNAASWQAVHVELPPGTATIRWSFAASFSGTAMLDGVSWTPGARPFCDAVEFSEWTLVSSGYIVDAGTLKPVSNPLMLRLTGSGAGILDIIPRTGDGAATLTSSANAAATRTTQWNAPAVARLILESGDHALDLSVRTGALERITLTNQPVTLGEAVDAPGQTFTTGGAGTWRGFAFPDALFAGDSAISPLIARGETAWMESSFTGPGIVTFSVRQMVFDSSFSLVVSVAGSPAAQTSPEEFLTTREIKLAIPSGVHPVRWEVRRAEPVQSLDYSSPYVLVDSLTFQSGSDIPGALDSPDRGWQVSGTVTTGDEGGEDIALLGGTISTMIEGPATVAFRWRAFGSLHVQWISLQAGSFGQPPAAGPSWQSARLILPSGRHRIDWTGNGAMDAVTVTQATPLTDAMELRGIDWRAVYLIGAWDAVSETNRLNGTVLRSRLTAPGTNRLTVYFHYNGSPLSFDWRRSSSVAGGSSFSASVALSPSIPPAGTDWTTASMLVLYGWRQIEWTHSSPSGSNEEARLDAVTTKPESYFRWANARGIGHAPTDADSDGDGVPNAVEFGTGSDPVSNASAIQPAPAFQWQPGGHLRIIWEFPPPPYDTTGLRWFLRGSNDLLAWWESPVTPAPFGGQLTVGTVTGQSARAYYQLRAAYEP